MMNEQQKHRVDYLNNWPNIPYFNKDILDLGNKDIFINLVKFKEINTVRYDETHNIILSFLIEGFYFLKTRPDISFDNFWKAFEISIKLLNHSTNVTDTIKDISNSNLLTKKGTKRILGILNKNIPYSILNNTLNSIKNTHNLKKNLKDNFNFQIIDYISDDKNFTTPHRDKVMFINKTLKKNSILVNGNIINLTTENINYFIIYGILYSNRNKRAHGNSISPFLSSNVTKSSYLFNYYMILYIYFYTMIILRNLKYVKFLNKDLEKSIVTNVNILNNLFEKRCWK